MEVPIDPVVASPRMEIHPGEPLGEALRRVMLEQLAVARDGFSLASDDVELDSKVHLARKAFKRTRAMLRLVRDDVGESEYRSANTIVRDQSRRLSDLRSARVLALTANTLGAANPTTIPARVVDDLCSELAARRAALVTDLRSDAAAIAMASSSLDVVEHQIMQWRLGDSFADITSSLRRVYRRGRRALEGARESGTAHAFHDWRKRVNYLRYQIEALSGQLSGGVAVLEGEFDVLSEMLGDEHDLAEFIQLIAIDDSPIRLPSDRAETLAAAERGRDSLQRDALELGTTLYADKPNRFVARLEIAWVT